MTDNIFKRFYSYVSLNLINNIILIDIQNSKRLCLHIVPKIKLLIVHNRLNTTYYKLLGNIKQFFRYSE